MDVGGREWMWMDVNGCRCMCGYLCEWMLADVSGMRVDVSGRGWL